MTSLANRRSAILLFSLPDCLHSHRTRLVIKEKEISAELNIGLDSLVFIDDNAMERNIVESQLPSVSVPNVGNNILDFIDIGANKGGSYHYIKKNFGFDSGLCIDIDINKVNLSIANKAPAICLDATNMSLFTDNSCKLISILHLSIGTNLS